MPYAHDVPPQGEEKVINKIVESILAMQRRSYKPGQKARRALHGKSLGVVKGTFVVRSLPEELRIGIFARPSTFSTVARFSNGALSAEAPDILPNVRGLAIKLYGVDGPKVLQGDENSTEQDFIMANDPIFFVKEIQHFAYLTARDLKAIACEAPGTIGRMLSSTTKIVPTLFGVDYFSQVPHVFGERACKYALFHQPENTAAANGGAGFANPFDNDYLRHDINSRLHKNAAHFVFSVQFQLAGESVSDSTKLWQGEYIPLADLFFSKITADIAEADGEDLSFNPARSLVEHEPIAWPARLRKAVYAADFKWRAAQNGNSVLSLARK